MSCAPAACAPLTSGAWSWSAVALRWDLAVLALNSGCWFFSSTITGCLAPVDRAASCWAVVGRASPVSAWAMAAVVPAASPNAVTATTAMRCLRARCMVCLSPRRAATPPRAPLVMPFRCLRYLLRDRANEQRPGTERSRHAMIDVRHAGEYQEPQKDVAALRWPGSGRAATL